MLLQIPKSHPHPLLLLWWHNDLYHSCHKSDHLVRIYTYSHTLHQTQTRTRYRKTTWMSTQGMHTNEEYHSLQYLYFLLPSNASSASNYTAFITGRLDDYIIVNWPDINLKKWRIRRNPTQKPLYRTGFEFGTFKLRRNSNVNCTATFCT